MSEEFDASRVCSDPVSSDLLAKQDETIAHLMQRPNALANAKLHAENELIRLVNLCNRLAWRYVPPELREPTPEEAATLLERLSQEDRHKLINDSTQANEQRALAEKMRVAWEQCEAQMQAEQQALEQREAEERERAEFEAWDAAEKEKRFEAWRAARRTTV